MKFTLRDLFWLVVVIGCLCAFYVESRRSEIAIQALTKQRNTWIEFAATAQTKVKTAAGGKLTYLEGGDVEYDELPQGVQTGPERKLPTYDLEILPVVP
jgi:hypothetical protein